MAGLIGLPAARVELAEIGGKPGVVVESIVPERWEEELRQPVRVGELIHGNEILAGRIEGYEKENQRAQEQHSFKNITDALKESVPSEQFQSVMEQFAGLIVLDALIGNQDRHHENWALLRVHTSSGEQIALAHSYDHASSLGRELTDRRRRQYLQAGEIPDYVRRGHGAIFGESTGRHADNPLTLLRWAANCHPSWFRPWIDRIGRLEKNRVDDMIKALPDSVISNTAREFCLQFILFTLDELKGVLE